MLNSNTWNHLIVSKEINFNSFEYYKLFPYKLYNENNTYLAKSEST